MDAESIIGNSLEILLKCKENGEFLSKQTSPSIYMVPSVVRELSPSSFTPRVVAIGPLHKYDEHLQRLEVQKPIYFHYWLHRFGFNDPVKTLRECVVEVIGSIKRVKACYGGLTTYDDVELSTMMVIDACFILEFIESPLRTNMLTSVSILHDLLLIENQIPFFVLEIIFDSTALLSGQLKEGVSLTTYIKLLVESFLFVEANVVVPDASAPDHIIGFLHKYVRPTKPMLQVSQSSRKRHTAIEFDRAGMKFKPNTEEQNWALAMKLEFPLPLFPWFHIFMAIPPFSWFQRPTLRMPKVRIDDGSELILRNLVVYEQCSDVEKYVTSYLSAMDMLIDSPEDVALLEKSKVLHNLLGSNEEAADMINKLCKNILSPTLFYDKQWEEMDAYYNSYWPRMVARLKRTYFNNPWRIIALIGAFLLFVLTVVQTIFTIKGTV